MPLIKTKRDDIIREKELQRLLDECERDTVDGKKVVNYGKNLFQIKFIPTMIQCLIALMWLFGKRITETLRLKRKDIWVDEEWLYVRFRVLKKRSRKSEPIPVLRLKKITLDNPYVPYVTRYINTITNDDAWLFPGRKRKREFDVPWTNPETNEVIVYHYVDEDVGRMGKEHAWRIMKGLSKSVWNHLFRTSLATTMAEFEATEEHLMNWFDWDKYETAHGYVKAGPRLTEKWSKRKW